MQHIKGARQTELIVMIALFSALITVMTAFIKIPTPLGYIHIGDAFIFAAAMLLGPYAAIPAMIGSGLADFITAYFMYIPATILIKGLGAFRICARAQEASPAVEIHVFSGNGIDFCPV